ncbi:MAG: helix-turn-helix domain-containing protein [Betaproteobacteria bacterium]|nr:helix-turn-helix domain-containing protein [Betaproteobacteria bacterium]
MSNAEFARKLDVSPPYISKIMRGDENFTIEAMVKFARAAGAKLHLQIADESDAVRWVQVISTPREKSTEKENANAYLIAQKALSAKAA